MQKKVEMYETLISSQEKQIVEMRKALKLDLNKKYSEEEIAKILQDGQRGTFISL